MAGANSREKTIDCAVRPLNCTCDVAHAEINRSTSCSRQNYFHAISRTDF